MIDLFSPDLRRDPFAAYARMRDASPVFHLAPFDVWMIFDYDGVKRALSDHETFSSEMSRVPGQGNPGQWFIFFDPPRHTKLRAIISKAFTPRVVAGLEPRIRALSRRLLDDAVARGANGSGEMDLVGDFAVPLPMRVIAQMLGVPDDDWPRYRRWSDVIVRLANTFARDEESARTIAEYRAVTAEMGAFIPELIDRRRRDSAAPDRAGGHDDLLTRLVDADVDGQWLSPQEVLGFVQLLLTGGQETTANLISNAVLCFIERPDQLARLRSAPELLPNAIEEVLRYRSPGQWMPRATTRAVELHGRTIPPGKLVLPMIGSANRDPRHFPDPDRFDIARDTSRHLGFGHGPHACLGAPLARMEARIALSDFLQRIEQFELAGDERWEPRQALHVHGPERLPIRFTTARVTPNL